MSAKVLQFVDPTHNSDGRESVNANQHRLALASTAKVGTLAFSLALREMLTGWERYAEAHQARYGESIGNDGVIGDYWAEVGLAIKRLFDGETGGLDCGSVTSNITAAIEAVGIKTDGYIITDRDND